MDDIKVSLVASAIYTKFWPRFYESLKHNTISYEVIFVGNKKPDFELPENFRWIYATVKPVQCYEIGFRAARGELIHWTADDAMYVCNNILDNIDRCYNFYKQFNDYKTIVAIRTIEDGRDICDFHHFFGGQHNTPVMSPFGFISNKFMKELGGYDRRFVIGQSENDLVMRAYEHGGRVEICTNAYVCVTHTEVHEAQYNKYIIDRAFLESAWVSGGHISNKRLVPLELFGDREDICMVGQGQQSIEDIVIEGYRNILKREPDPGGLSAYTNHIKNGMSIDRFHEMLITSEEYRQRFG